MLVAIHSIVLLLKWSVLLLNCDILLIILVTGHNLMHENYQNLEKMF